MTRPESPRTARSVARKTGLRPATTESGLYPATHRANRADVTRSSTSSTLLAGTSSLTPTEYRALLAVMGGARSVRAVAAEIGRAVSTTYSALSWLRRLDLVAWDRGRAGTLRPSVRVVSGPWG